MEAALENLRASSDSYSAQIAPNHYSSKAADGSLTIPNGHAFNHLRLSSPTGSSTSTTTPPSAIPSSEYTAKPDPAKPYARQTLEIPPSTRRTVQNTARDPSGPETSNYDDLQSPTSSRISSSAQRPRRGSLSLGRRITSSFHSSDMQVDELSPDEIRQRRAARRRRKEEEDDDRVLVGTKVDQNHANWITAYNMLTGIRFSVSRTTAKMDRELTHTDFEATYKFGFDV